MAEACDVLVVDDEAVVRDAILKVLHAEGFSVAAAADAAEATAHPATGSCRLVLCDLMLPDASGAALVGRLRAKRPRLPVVMMTGYLSAGEGLPDAASPSASTWTGFIRKPFDTYELLAAVRQALGAAGAAEETRP